MRNFITLLLLFILSLLFAIQPLRNGLSDEVSTETIRSGRTTINPLHVGNKWWFYNQTLWDPNPEPWITLSREVVADTVVNGETYYLVEGIGGGSTYCPIWQINRGDSIFILDTEDYDNNPETSELLYFDWSLDEDNDVCMVFPLFYGSPYPVIQRFDGSYERSLFGGEPSLCKHFAFDDTQVFQSWTTDFGPIEEEIEDGWAQLVACEIDGVFYGDSTVLVIDEPVMQSPDINLSCYPNPFNPETNIAFDIPQGSEVEITIYNLKGQKVRTLQKGWLDAGSHSIVWNGRDNTNSSCSSGIYLIRMQHGKEIATSKALLLK